MDEQLGEKIGEGRYREVFQIDENTCGKRLKDTIEKEYFGHNFSFPAKPYHLFKFRTGDFNHLEFQNFNHLMNQLPEESKKYFAKVRSLASCNGNSTSICDLVKNSDGSFPETLKETGKVSDEGFWEAIDYLKSIFIEREIPYFGVHEGNILVQNAKNEVRPVFMDYKRVGMRTFPFQPWVHLPGEKRRKITRLFDRLKNHKE